MGAGSVQFRGGHPGKVNGPRRSLHPDMAEYLNIGVKGDSMPDQFLEDELANLTLDIDTVEVVNRHNNVLGEG